MLRECGMLFCEYVYEWVGQYFAWGHMLVLMDVCLRHFLCGYVAVCQCVDWYSFAIT